MDNQLTERLYDAIDGAISDAVNKAGYNRTIQATITKCVDATIGQYQCKYQDSSFYAYSEDTNATYTDGSSVYIEVPNNDLNGTKRIIGSVKKLGINYVDTTEEENFYDKNGSSCINDKNEIFGLKSYKKEDYLLLYDKESKVNKVDMNIEVAKEYLKESTSLMIETTIQTKLDKIQQLRGNYGIRFLLDFENNSDGATTTKEFCLDVDKISGNPYKLVKPTRQYVIFDIDYGKFQAINRIELYSKDFPNKNESKGADIFFSNINLFGANRMSQTELNGCGISFITPQGKFFNTNNTTDKQIKAQVKLKGKVVDPKVQNIEFYWYREDLRTTLNSEFYNSIGGRGWRCLNPKTIIQAASPNEQDVVEWIPMGDTFVVTYNDALAYENKFRCVVKFDGRTFHKDIIIKNEIGNFKSTIESDNGQVFHYDIGECNLTCVANYNQANVQLEYAWAMESNDGFLTFLPETTEINNKLKQAEKDLKAILDKIAEGEKFVNAEQANIDELNKKIQEYKNQQRVDGRYLYNVDLTQIEQQATYKCSTYDKNGAFLGTASIVIQNLKDQTQKARLVINNGSQVFKYNEQGIAPTNTSLENPIDLKALSYTIYDEDGNEVSFEVSRKCPSKWKVPIKRTMLKDVSGDMNPTPDPSLEFEYHNNQTILTYKLADKFDYNKDINNIELTVDYKGVKLFASTNFTFTKQGDPGTNGTDYVCRIELTGGVEPYPKFPIVLVYNSYYSNLRGQTNIKNADGSYLMLSANPQPMFKASLYANGDRVTIPASSVSWKILQNKYAANVTDESYYDIATNSSGQCTVALNSNNIKNITCPANLIQCQISYNGMNFYDVMPIITCTGLSDGHTIELKENSGFEYVLYSSDGRLPTYNDADPFDIVVNKRINGIYEDISNIVGDHAVSYTWEANGQVKRKSKTGWNRVNVSSLELKTRKTIAGDEVLKNQRYAVPPGECDGECLTYCIKVNVKNKNDTSLGIIHIPIYLYLNRYGISSVNAWDGSSVQIKEEGGYILAPQIGAGKKENDNSFTGVLMGEVREANRSSSDVGLLGYSHGEKTFFIDAEDGTTMLGKKSNGRLTIDPSENKALIYSDNFWSNYTEKGKPTNYNTTNEAGAGMLIDLTTPEIKFGKKTSKGNYTFRVDSNGAITSTSGKIGGFKITDTSIQHEKTLYDDNKDGLYLGSDGTIGLGKNKFTVDSTGYMKAISGKIAAFNFDDKKLYSNGKTSAGSTAGGIFIDTDSAGENTDIKFRLGSQFYVTKDGTLTAKAGTLGNFHLTTSALYSGEKNSWDSDKAGIFISNSGQLRIGGKTQIGTTGTYRNNFSVTSDGNLTCSKGTIGGWTIGSSTISAGNTTLSSTGAISTSNFSVSTTGAISSTSGKIGGWNIGTSSLKGGNMYLNSDGSCGGSNWSISAGGYAKFSNFNGNGSFSGSSSGSFSGSGSGTFSGSGGGGIGRSGLYGGLGGTSGTNGDILNAINARINNLDVLSKLVYAGTKASWISVSKLVSWSHGKEATFEQKMVIGYSGTGNIHTVKFN